MRVIRLSSAVLLLAAAAGGGTARAADAPSVDWSGLAFGGFIGHSAGRLLTTGSSLTTDGTLFGIGSVFDPPNSYPGDDIDFPFGGGFAGALIGINRQIGATVLGAEADIAGANFFYSHTIPGEIGGDAQIETTGRLHWFGTLRGTVGFAIDRFHIYGTGGVAYGKGSGTIAVTASGGSVPPAYVSSGSRMQYGYALGAGIDAALDAHWAVRLEYLYLNLGPTRYDFAFPTAPGSSAISSETVIGNIVRAGVTYRF